MSEIITTNPHVANGLPCIRDTGITVKQIQKMLPYAKDMEILQSYPMLNLLDLKEVRDLNGKEPEVAATIMYSVEAMRAAYEMTPHCPFEEWITAFDKGYILHPPFNDETRPESQEPIINPAEQNLPEETKKTPETDN
jgi:uncharacterized protein (DUF433 family)